MIMFTCLPFYMKGFKLAVNYNTTVSVEFNYGSEPDENSIPPIERLSGPGPSKRLLNPRIKGYFKSNEDNCSDGSQDNVTLVTETGRKGVSLIKLCGNIFNNLAILT